MLGLEGEAAEPRAKMASSARVRRLARGLDARCPTGSASCRPGRPGTLSGCPRAGAGAASTRRPAAARRRRLAAHLLGFVNREGAGQYGVEQFYQDRSPATPRISLAQRDAAGNRSPTPRPSSRPGTPGKDLLADDRRGPPGRGRAGAARRVDRRPREAGLGRRDGPVQRRGLRLRELPVVRRQRLPGGRRDGARRGSSTRSCPPSTSPVRVQDADPPPRRSGDGTVTPTKIKDIGTLRLDGGTDARVDNADHRRWAG